MTETLTDLAKRLEHFETPMWAAESILECELLTPLVIDPCTGTGVLAEAMRQQGYDVIAQDIHNWGYGSTKLCDWLGMSEKHLQQDRAFSVMMNPPFSLAVEFVEKAFELGARKVLCFQRLAWRESSARRDFWCDHPPNRIYICGSRATCWRHDIPADQRNSGSTTAHAWFVWERGHPAGTLTDAIYRPQADENQIDERQIDMFATPMQEAA